MENEVVFSALVIDDDHLVRRLQQRLLELKGFQAMSVENGQEAIDLFRNGASFDLVLTDLVMPVMNGIEVTKELRSMDVKSRIVGIAGCDSGNRIQEFVEAGLDCCFRKPLSIKKVNAIVKLLLQK